MCYEKRNIYLKQTTEILQSIQHNLPIGVLESIQHDDETEVLESIQHDVRFSALETNIQLVTHQLYRAMKKRKANLYRTLILRGNLGVIIEHLKSRQRYMQNRIGFRMRKVINDLQMEYRIEKKQLLKHAHKKNAKENKIEKRRLRYMKKLRRLFL